ncbi:peptidyl-prolyl cis-trans isomerase [Seohaeicola saemankumensis]|nr:peptidylprolyl isomerase [Seohaeicola saemankumensis]MCA0871324.1 peptidyl-prolyl cis-trans isomerase [Seohaeicola saemankumensis]
MRKLLREPIVHFVLIGVLLFVYFDLSAEPAPAAGPADVVTVDRPEVSRIIDRYTEVWKRPPTEAELETLVTAAVREEIMVREALALGLDRGDAAIRNRLVQKMQFLTESATRSLDPSDEVLQDHLDANAERFAAPPVVAFEQIFLGPEPSEDEIADVRAQLAAGVPPQELGQRSLLPAALPLASPRQVDGAFGAGFAAALAAAEPGAWSGPYRSGFGQHLVRVSERRDGGVPALATVRDKVLFDWRRTQAETLAEAQFDALAERYKVTVPDREALREILAQ